MPLPARADAAHSPACHHPGRRIYKAAGYAGLRSSEAYQETSVFELDATDTYHAFFDGREDADRDYLLLNGDARADRPPAPSEEELEAGGCDVPLPALWPQAVAVGGGEGGGGEEGGGESGGPDDEGPDYAPWTDWQTYRGSRLLLLVSR